MAEPNGESIELSAPTPRPEDIDLPERAHLEAPSAPPARRRVQWIGLADEDEHDHRPAGVSHDGHTSVPISPNERPAADSYFSAADSSGTNTPEPFSVVNTPEGSRPATPTYEDEPIDIIAGERDGLPTSGERATRAFGREAAKLVAVHKAKGRFRSLGGRGRQGEGGVDAAAVAAALRADMARAEVTQEGARAGSSSRPAPAAKPAGHGVLSSLLRLYDQPSLASSQATLVDPSPPRPPPPSRPSFDGLGSALRSAGRSAGEAVTKAAPFLEFNDRPAQARSSGGVFAALQAGALDLAGPAAPRNTTVRPAPGRSGFRVKCVGGRGIDTDARSRHGLDDQPAPADRSPPSSSGGTTPAGFGSRPGHKGSHLSLQHLGEVFAPANFYNEVRRRFVSAADCASRTCSRRPRPIRSPARLSTSSTRSPRSRGCVAGPRRSKMRSSSPVRRGATRYSLMAQCTSRPFFSVRTSSCASPAH